MNPPSSGDDCSGEQTNAQINLKNVNSFNTNLDDYQPNSIDHQRAINKSTNKFTPNADYELNTPAFGLSSINTLNGGFHDESSAFGNKMEATLADIIIPEYPADCFPDNWYERFPICLEDTEFWRKWKKLRCVKFGKKNL